ncbi:MAG: hypothetical protein ABJA16_01785 [Nakamurella sp.]
MRTPPPSTDRTLTVSSGTTDGIGCLTLRGAAVPDTLDPLLSAIDTLFAAGVRGIVVDAAGVTCWSRRGLEIAVLTSTRAQGRRIAFAVCGLPDDQLDVLRRRWPGVRSHQFAYVNRSTGLAAIAATTS